MTILPNVTIELIPDTEQGGFTAHILGLPAYGEGKTQKEAIDDLKFGVDAFIQENGMEETLSRITPSSQLCAMNFGELVGA